MKKLLRLGDTSDVPKRILDSIPCQRMTIPQDIIIDIIASLDGHARVDEVMIHLYKKYGLEVDRKKIVAVLWRMSGNGLLKKLSNMGEFGLIDYKK